MNLDLTVDFCGEKFNNPFLNATGVLDNNQKNMNTILDSKAGGLITKSATLKFRNGNPEPRFYSNDLGSINSMGLPNEGLQYYLDFLGENFSKPVVLSISGTSLTENLEMINLIKDSNFNGMVELNLSCPNIPGQPQVGYDFKLTKQILENVFEVINQPLGVKLPPYFDFFQFDQMAAILNQFPLAFINSVNSIGNGLIIDPKTEAPVIKPKDGFGGIGGSYIKPTALANVRAFRKLLSPKIKIIGTGGIKSGLDAFEMILTGADLVSVGTALETGGVSLFDKLISDLESIMERKHYSQLSDFRNHLKTINKKRGAK